MDKKKILWVVYDFVQAGGQRHVFEIAKALNKNKYQIDFLKVNQINSDTNWNQEFYYQPTLDLDSSIFILPEILKTSNNNIAQKIARKIRKKFGFNSTLNVNRNDQERVILEKIFLEYKYVNFSGIAVFETVCIGRGLNPPNALINILTAKFQGVDIYKNYDKKLYYHFISGFEPSILSNELSEFNNFKHTYFPLSLDSISFEGLINNGNEKLVIGIFTRLSAMKPLDPYFYALKLLLEQGLNVELRIYGAGNPEKLGFIRQLDYLYLKENVFFCGHTESIQQTLIKEHFDLIWFQAADSQIAGYAALEIALCSIPQVLWDFSYRGSESEVKNFFPSFTNISLFVNYNKKLLNSKEKLEELGMKQRQFVLEQHSIEKNIIILENIYDNGIG
jgi:glycosyltransferase involved in cell wall biosynthesis